MKLTDITTEDLTTLVGLLTETQKEQLIGQQYAPDSYFNPIQDIDDNWIISTEEMMGCTNEEFMWVKDLELIEFKPKPSPIVTP
jgi:hypothetical protein